MLSVLGPDDGGLADWPATSPQLLALMLVALLAAEVSLIHFNRASEGVTVRAVPRFADAVQHEPRGGLR